uniref:Complexin-2 n=1 Tax=Parastrongyloides trichosuri TaxID=131310 RepID=A0A0N4ZW04_PARTI
MLFCQNVNTRSSVLGELDEKMDSNEEIQNEWDTEIDLDSVNKTEKEQKRKEREMRHKERLMEHQRKLKEKRGEVL